MNILVAVDFSDVAELVLAQARRLAKLPDAKVWLLHAATPKPAFLGYGPGPQHVRKNLADEFRREHQQLQDYAAQLRQAGIAAEALLVQGPAADVIVLEADRLRADIIVLGSHGHGAMHQLMLGSVSDAVLRKTRRPVLIVPVRQ
jgi:nucleotide-binding universal stress UspA family protein